MHVYLHTKNIAVATVYDGESHDVIFNQEDLANALAKYPPDTIFRCLGGHENSLLLLGLFPIVDPKWTTRVQVMSPHRKEVRDLEGDVLFAAMSNLELPSSVGGWRFVTEEDHLIATGMEFCKPEEPFVELFQEIAKPVTELPFFKKALFASQSPYDLMQVIGLIGDPRWFYQPDSEDGQSSLYSYFGVNPTVYEQFKENQFKNHLTARLGLLIDTWNLRPEGAQRKTFIDDYLTSKATPDPKYTLRACQIFLDFLRGVWLAELSSPEFFAPDLFFRNPNHAQDFKEYCANLT
jgi:hypothetical protein